MKIEELFIILLLLISILHSSSFTTMQESAEVKTEKILEYDKISEDSTDQFIQENSFYITAFTSKIQLLTPTSLLYRFHFSCTLLRPPIYL